MLSPPAREHVDEKAALRSRVLSRRSGLSSMALAASSARACAHLLRWPVWQSAERAAAYAARGGELSLAPVVRRTRPRVALPRMVSARPPRLAFFFVDGAPLVPERRAHKLGLMTPPDSAVECPAADVDVALVPGVAFCADGRRLGHGGGYYDAWLPTAVRAVRVGVAHPFAVVDALPVDALDEPVDFLLTPDGLSPTGARPLPAFPFLTAAQPKEPS